MGLCWRAGSDLSRPGVDEEVYTLEGDVGDLVRQVERLEIELEKVRQRYRGLSVDLEEYDYTPLLLSNVPSRSDRV